MLPRNRFLACYAFTICCVVLLDAFFRVEQAVLPSGLWRRGKEGKSERTVFGGRRSHKRHERRESRESSAFAQSTESAFSGTSKKSPAEVALTANDVKAALKDIWRSESLSELHEFPHLNNGISETISILERFLCTQERYVAHVDTYQSARCLALCEKDAIFARKHASTTCKYYHLRAQWSRKFPERAYVWTADLHSGPFSCDESLMREAGAETHAEIQYSKCAYSNVCADRLRVFRNDNLTGYSLGDDPQKLRRDFFEAYKHDPEFARVDAFLCTHPTANCELFMPFNKSIIINAAARIEFGRYDDNIPWRRARLTSRSYDQWRQWVKNLQLIAARPENVIMANNLYDVAYIKHMTGIDARHMPAWCGNSGVKYSPSRQSILIGPYRLADSIAKLGWGHPILRDLSRTNMGLRKPFEFQRITDVYPSYSFDDLASHRAIVFLPYQVSIMSFFEYYRMGIPLFVPSKDLLLEWDDKYDVVSERIYGHVEREYDARSRAYRMQARADGAGKKKDERDRLPNPNVKTNFKHWIHLCDFYVFPHVQYFSSWEDLVGKLQKANMQGISKAMLRYSDEQRPILVEKWRDVMRKIARPSREGARVVPTDFDEAVKELYNQPVLEARANTPSRFQMMPVAK